HVVVPLGDHRPLLLLEAFDHPQLPKRPTAIKPTSHQVTDQRSKLIHVPRVRNSSLTEVIVEVEVPVVYPDGAAKFQGERPGHLTVPGDKAQLARNHVPQSGE